MSECAACGVAFNVGAQVCQESDCPIALAALTRANRNRYTRDKKQDPIVTRLNSCKLRARSRGMGFDLTYQFVVATLKQPCSYCWARGKIQLDRRDNTLGYLQDNVVPACARCNEVKGRHLTYTEMVKVAEVLGWRK
jgi:hypothetical protein